MQKVVGVGSLYFVLAVVDGIFRIVGVKHFFLSVENIINLNQFEKIITLYLNSVKKTLTTEVF
jgi:hypothetical protein